MLELWLKIKGSIKLIAWAAPQVQQWKRDYQHNRVEGDRQLKARQFAEAEVCLTEAVEECDDRIISPSTRIRLQLQLAEAQRKQGAQNRSKLDEAEETIRSALELTARVSNPSGYVQCVDALAEVYHDRGDIEGMERLIQEGVRVEVAMPHPDPIRMARRMHRLAVARHLQGADAIPALEKALEGFEQAFGADHLETAEVLAEAGILYRGQGRHQDSQRCLRRALRIHERELGRVSTEAVRDLHHLAASHEEAGDIESAAALWERALEVRDRIVGSDLEEFAEMQYRVANLYVDWGNYSRARELLAMCIGTFRRKKGARLAVAYELLAHVEEYSGRFRDALVELERASHVWEVCGPERATELATNLEYRAGLLEQMKKKDSANWLREKAAAARAGSYQT